MKELLAITGALIILFCTVPYIIDTVKGKTKPNIVTWSTWTLLIGIGAAALFASHQYRAAMLVTADTVATFAVVIVGLRYGIAKFDSFDLFCLIGAVVGLVLWLVFNSPMIAIVATLSIDFIGTIPTVRHSWQNPEEETYITFALGVLATLLTLLSLKAYPPSAWIYPAYLMFSNGLLWATIIISHRSKSRKASKIKI